MIKFIFNIMIFYEQEMYSRKMKKKIKKVRNNGWEKLKFIEQNSKNKKKYSWINLQTPCTILKDQEFC